jgi:hypothetical protein
MPSTYNIEVLKAALRAAPDASAREVVISQFDPALMHELSKLRRNLTKPARVTAQTLSVLAELLTDKELETILEHETRQSAQYDLSDVVETRQHTTPLLEALKSASNPSFTSDLRRDLRSGSPLWEDVYNALIALDPSSRDAALPYVVKALPAFFVRSYDTAPTYASHIAKVVALALDAGLQKIVIKEADSEYVMLSALAYVTVPPSNSTLKRVFDDFKMHPEQAMANATSLADRLTPQVVAENLNSVFKASSLPLPFGVSSVLDILLADVLEPSRAASSVDSKLFSDADEAIEAAELCVSDEMKQALCRTALGYHSYFDRSIQQIVGQSESLAGHLAAVATTPELAVQLIRGATVGTLRAHLSSDVLKDLLLLAIPGHNKLLKQVLEEDLPLDLLVVLPMLPSSALKNPVAARATSIVIADRLKDEASQRLAWQMATSWHGSLNELVAAVELTAPLQGSE